MSASQVNLKDIQNRFSEVLSQAKPGEEIIVMDGDQPLAKLIPLRPRRPTKLGLHPGAIQMGDDFDEQLPEEFWLGET